MLLVAGLKSLRPRAIHVHVVWRRMRFKGDTGAAWSAQAKIECLAHPSWMLLRGIVALNLVYIICMCIYIYRYTCLHVGPRIH